MDKCSAWAKYEADQTMRVHWWVVFDWNVRPVGSVQLTSWHNCAQLWYRLVPGWRTILGWARHHSIRQLSEPRSWPTDQRDCATWHHRQPCHGRAVLPPSPLATPKQLWWTARSHGLGWLGLTQIHLQSSVYAIAQAGWRPCILRQISGLFNVQWVKKYKTFYWKKLLLAQKCSFGTWGGRNAVKSYGTDFWTSH